MFIEPIGDNIILQLPMEERKDEVTSAGIIIPKSTISDSQARKDIAIVVATGEGRTLNNGTLLPLKVKAGQKVLFNKYAGTQVIVDNKKFLIIKESDILGIIND